MTTKKRSEAWTFITILGLVLCAGLGTLINPCMQKLIEQYPDTPVSTVRMLSTICSLEGVLISLPLTFFFGKRIRFKPLMVLAPAFTLCGMIPFFIPNPPFAVVFLSRALVGVGFGLVTLRNACIRKMFADDPVKMAKWLGLASSIVTAASTLASPISGALGDISLRLHYLLYGIASIPLLINIFVFQEPADEAPAAEASKAEKAPRGKLSPKVLLYSLLVVLMTLFSFPIFTGMSTLIQARGLGAAAISGTVTACYSLGQVVGSALFAALLNKVKSRLVSIDLLVVSIGFGLIVLAQNVFVAMIGAFLTGFGFIEFTLILMKWAGDISDKSTVTFATTLLTTSISIGSFFSTYWITAANKLGSGFSFLSTDAERTYMLATILFAATAILLFLFNVAPKQHELQH